MWNFIKLLFGFGKKEEPAHFGSLDDSATRASQARADTLNNALDIRAASKYPQPPLPSNHPRAAPPMPTRPVPPTKDPQWAPTPPTRPQPPKREDSAVYNRAADQAAQRKRDDEERRRREQSDEDDRRRRQVQLDSDSMLLQASIAQTYEPSRHHSPAPAYSPPEPAYHCPAPAHYHSEPSHYSPSCSPDPSPPSDSGSSSGGSWD